MKILLIKPSSLGDVVHALPTANLLRKTFPEATIAWLINDSLVGLLKNCPVINAIIPFYRQRWGHASRWSEFLLYLRKLKEQEFDLAIDLQGLFRSGVLARASGAPRRVGLSDAREGAGWFYNEIVSIPPGVTHAVDRYLQTISHLGSPIGTIEFPFGESAEDKEAVSELLKSQGAGGTPLIAFSPCARWDNKRWAAESYAELARQVEHQWKPHRVVLIGEARDEKYLCSIANQSSVRPIVMAGALTFGQLIDLLRRCSLFFGNDTGPTHIAAALNVPTVEIFGPTDPAKTGPHSTQLDHTIVVRRELPCAPCLKPTCSNSIHLECLHTISVRDVLEAADTLMDRRGGLEDRG